jgi:L-malate glycosyltransferase
MRIAFVSLMGGIPWGGSEALWAETAKYSLSQEDDVLVSVFDWGKLPRQVKELQELGATIHLREKYNPRASIFKKIKTAVKVRLPIFNETFSSIISFNPDAVIISQGDSFDLAVHHRQLYEKLVDGNIPFYLICHSHSQYGDIPHKNIFPDAVEVFKNAKKIFFVSKRMQQVIERKLCYRLPNALHTWNPLNLANLEYLNYSNTNSICFAMVGLLGGVKGHDTLFEVLANEKWRTRDWQLSIYGEGYGDPYLRNLAQFYDITDKIIFKGHVKDASEIWKYNNLLLIPSAGEGLPISLVEAMVAGRAAVVTDVGGNTELIEEGITGFIADAPSVKSLSNALEQAWMQKDRWLDMGKMAREVALKKINLKPQIKLYKEVTATK